MKRIEDLLKESGITGGIPLDYCPVKLKEKNRVNLLALGDVGTTVLIGLRLLGADVISIIGICDIDESNMVRCEQEINQINYPFETQGLPEVKMVGDVCSSDLSERKTSLTAMFWSSAPAKACRPSGQQAMCEWHSYLPMAK